MTCSGAVTFLSLRCMIGNQCIPKNVTLWLMDNVLVLTATINVKTLHRLRRLHQFSQQLAVFFLDYLDLFFCWQPFDARLHECCGSGLLTAYLRSCRATGGSAPGPDPVQVWNQTNELKLWSGLAETALTDCCHPPPSITSETWLLQSIQCQMKKKLFIGLLELNALQCLNQGTEEEIWNKLKF